MGVLLIVQKTHAGSSPQPHRSVRSTAATLCFLRQSRSSKLTSTVRALLLSLRGRVVANFKRKLNDGEVLDCSDLEQPDRKSTRLNSSHITISYAVFCLK